MKQIHKAFRPLLVLIIGLFFFQEAKSQSFCYGSFYYVAQARKMTFFDYYSMPDSGATITGYSWDFGDGTTGTGDTVAHTYQSSGYFSVTMEITTSTGCTNSLTYQVGVTNTPQCYTSFSYQNTGLTTQFYNYSWPGKGFVSSDWDFGDGGTSTDFEPSHTYANNGVYDVTLNTTDLTTGCTGSMTYQIYVYDCTGFSANFTSVIDTANLSVAFDASSSTGATSTTIYYWSYGDGAFDYPGVTNPTHQYATDGIYMVYLTMWDTATYCQSYSYQTLIVGTPKCAAVFYNYAGSADGLTQYFYSYSTNVDSNTTYSWDYGDGSTFSGTNYTGSYVNHTYSNYGTYNVCLTITNTNFNCNDTYCYNIAVFNPSSCVATFMDSAISLYDYQFTNTSSTSSQTSYYWDFGDGSTSTDENPIHTYSNGGQYFVYFTYLDSSTSCQAYAYRYISVNSSCTADFTYTLDTAKNNVTFTNTSTSSGSSITFTWDFGDGGSSNKENPIHHYANDGIYYVNLYIYDQSNGCYAYATHEVIVGNKTCFASFAQYLGIDDTITFYGYGLPYTRNFDYSWTFGDGTSGTGAYPRHRYATTGTYNVCVTISDSTCSDTYCMDVDYYHTASIYGFVYCGTDYMQPARVYVVQYDSVAGTLSAVDSVDLDSGVYYYSFTLPVGNYLLKAALLPSSAKYNDYIPTYYTQSMRWDSAQWVDLSISLSLNINMIAGQNSGGAGFIGGLVSQGANKTDGVGDPMPHVQVILLDANHNPIAYVHSGLDGKFKFENLPLGNYYLMSDMMNKTTNEMMVPLSSSMTSTNDVVVQVNSKDVDLHMASITGIKPIDASSFNLYPNPSNGQMSLGGDISKLKNMTIFNMDGRQIWKEQTNGKSTFDYSWLSSGVYLIVLEGNDGSSSRVRWVKY